MESLIWSTENHTGKITNAEKSENLKIPPDLGFSFHELFYEPALKKTIIDARPMSPLEISACSAYISGYFFFKNNSPALAPPKKYSEGQKRIAIQHFLQLTDWYLIRAAETGKPVPSAILERRNHAREYFKTNEEIKINGIFLKLAETEMNGADFLDAITSAYYSNSIKTE